jgi:hypothetical protein
MSSSFRFGFLAVVIALFGVARPVIAQSVPLAPSDPYAAGQRVLGNKEYEKAKAELLTRVRIANAAFRCRVIMEVDATDIAMEGIREISESDEAAGADG